MEGERSRREIEGWSCWVFNAIAYGLVLTWKKEKEVVGKLVKNICTERVCGLGLSVRVDQRVDLYILLSG